MLWILIVAVATLATSFLCSLLEASLYSVTPSKLEVMRERGVFGVERFARFRANVDEPIAAILTVNTVANTAGSGVLGWLVGGGSSLAVAMGAFTLAVLFVAEIVPKSLGVQYGPRLVPLLVWPLQLMIWLVWPISRACRSMMRALASNSEDQHLPTEEEVLAMSAMAASGGNLSKREATWVRNALQLDDVSARDLMTPRTVVEWVSADDTVQQVRAMDPLPRASRLPVVEGEDTDRIIGMVFRRDLLEGDLSDELRDKTMRELAVQMDFVPEAMKGPRLLAMFLRRRRHMSAVIDEYGGFEGIVTLEDVIECLLGAEIVDEHDEHQDLQELARARALARAAGGSGGRREDGLRGDGGDRPMRL